MIGIIDYGAGNLCSVKNALDYYKFKNHFIKKPEELKRVEKIILPGVGAFGSAIIKLKKSGLFDAIYQWLKKDQPFLGICLGLQLLFEESEESKGEKGFGIFRGITKRLRHYKIPQIGWNSVRILKDSNLVQAKKNILYFYFLHSYYVDTPERDLIIGMTEYGVEYPSIINRGNIYGIQFHPEKSGINGLLLLRNWVERC